MFSKVRKTGGKILFLLLLSLLSIQLVHATTGCERCAATGDCSYAFHSGPGQFCGTFQEFMTTKPCCCPTGSQCQLSHGQCNCFVPNTRGNTRGHSNNDDYYNEGSAFGFLKFIIIVIVLCWVCGCCRPDATPREVSGEFVPIAVPINTANGNPPPTAPSYDTYGSTSGTGRATSNDRGFAWGPALGGFALGEILGSMSGGRRERGYHNNHHRHNGGGGGGFTISGDSGGGGFGGGNTFRGDS